MVCINSVNVNIYIFGKHKQSDLQRTIYRGVIHDCKNVNTKDVLYKSLAISDYNITMIAAITM